MANLFYSQSDILSRYEKIRAYLESFIPPEKELFPREKGLARMRLLLSLLGNPHLFFPTIHVVGTSGKTSTATILAHILSAAGYKTGLTISPHLQAVNERMKIDGKMISLSHLEEMISKIKEDGIIEKMKKSALGKPSYFELLLLLAFLYFKKEKVDIAVVEAGLGGRWDGTNVISPLIGVITNIGLDHTEVLGNTVEAIAKDKAGIIKPGMVVVCGVKQERVKEIIKSKIKNQRSKIILLGEDFNYQLKELSAGGCLFHFNDIYHYSEIKNLRLSLIGKHQVENASLAIATASTLNKFNFTVSKKAIRRALATAFVPGRLEKVSQHPVVILDGAHNPDKMKTLVDSLSLFGKKRYIVVFAAKKDKRIDKMLNLLLKKADRLIISQFQTTTDLGKNMSLPGDTILAIVKKITSLTGIGSTQVEVIPQASKALAKAIKLAKTDGWVICTGSLYLVGEIRELWHPKEELLAP